MTKLFSPVRGQSQCKYTIVKRRKELGEYLTEKNVEMQYTEISLKSIEKVKKVFMLDISRKD